MKHTSKRVLPDRFLPILALALLFFAVLVLVVPVQAANHPCRNPQTQARIPCPSTATETAAPASKTPTFTATFTATSTQTVTPSSSPTPPASATPTVTPMPAFQMPPRSGGLVGPWLLLLILGAALFAGVAWYWNGRPLSFPKADPGGENPGDTVYSTFEMLGQVEPDGSESSEAGLHRDGDLE